MREAFEGLTEFCNRLDEAERFDEPHLLPIALDIFGNEKLDMTSEYVAMRKTAKSKTMVTARRMYFDNYYSFVLTDFGLDEESVRSYAEELAHMWEVTHYHRALRPHVREMLEGLKDLGMKLGVISNTASLYQVFDILKEYGIRDYFQDVTLSSVTGYRKPNPNIFMVSLHQVQSDPAHCAYVGDTISRDVIGPIRMGFGATFHIDSYLTRLKDTHVSPDVKATYNIQDIYEVYTILKESH